MPFDLKNKIVLVTGGASGIGACVVKCLLVEDVTRVVIIDVADVAGTALQDELNLKYGANKVKFIKCDITDHEDLKKVFKEVKEESGAIDVFINSAGILDDSLNGYLKEININLTALITSNLEAWEMMRKDKGGAGGTIINLSSIAALSKTVNVPIYSATKVAVLKFGTSIGDDSHYLRSRVRVLTVCCGLTLTPLIENTIAKIFDEGAFEGLLKDTKKFKTQSPESAALGIIQTYKQGKNGGVWIVTSGKPAVDVTDIYNKSYELFDEYAYN